MGGGGTRDRVLMIEPTVGVLFDFRANPRDSSHAIPIREGVPIAETGAAGVPFPVSGAVPGAAIGWESVELRRSVWLPWDYCARRLRSAAASPSRPSVSREAVLGSGTMVLENVLSGCTTTQVGSVVGVGRIESADCCVIVTVVPMGAEPVATKAPQVKPKLSPGCSDRFRN